MTSTNRKATAGGLLFLGVALVALGVIITDLRWVFSAIGLVCILGAIVSMPSRATRTLILGIVIVLIVAFGIYALLFSRL